MKNKNKRFRITPVFVGMLLFIALVMGLINHELENNKIRSLILYNSQQEQNISSLSLLLKDKQESGMSDDEIKGIIPSIYEATGNRFLVFECNGEVIFAKTLSNTEKLYDNRNSDSFWESIKKQDVQISSNSWEMNGKSYTLSIITETDSIYEQMSLVMHNYYILLATVFVCIVLFSLLVTYVGILDRTTKDLSKTEAELINRNVSIENYISEGQNNNITSSRADANERFERRYNRREKFFDISVLRNLLSKSDEEDLKPIKLITVKFNMTERYYSASEIKKFASIISEDLRNRETLFELRKGLFAVLIYRCSDAEVNMRIDTFSKRLEVENSKNHIFNGFDFDVFSLGASDDSVIEEFEKKYKTITGQNYEV